MVVVDVLPNGQAPQGLSVGDFVNTAGGMYQIAPAGAYGAVYNPKSGYWSYNTKSDDYQLQTMINSAQAQADRNTASSQAMAREQMLFQNASAEKAMQFSASQAAMNRDWQERMSNTAHQREVQDLIAAGLNPILSANSSGATTPSGATASGVAASGASGTVDTSGTSAITQLLSTMYNAAVSLDISKMQVAANMYAADRGLLGAQASAGATMAAAAAASAATRYSADKSYAATLANLAWQEQSKELYPGNPWDYAGSVIRSVTAALNGQNSGSLTYQFFKSIIKAAGPVISQASAARAKSYAYK